MLLMATRCFCQRVSIPFTIDKKITVRGAGQETLTEDITIAIPDLRLLPKPYLKE